jgi:hypothetical protein
VLLLWMLVRHDTASMGIDAPKPKNGSEAMRSPVRTNYIKSRPPTPGDRLRMLSLRFP